MFGTAWEQDFSENNFLQCRIKSKVTQWTIIKTKRKGKNYDYIEKIGDVYWKHYKLQKRGSTTKSLKHWFFKTSCECFSIVCIAFGDPPKTV